MRETIEEYLITQGIAREIFKLGTEIDENEINRVYCKRVPKEV